MLKMKPKCEECQVALPLTAAAYICSYECTFCDGCASGMSHICPNCSGELLRRPTRIKNPVAAATGQVVRRIQKLISG